MQAFPAELTPKMYAPPHQGGRATPSPKQQFDSLWTLHYGEILVCDTAGQLHRADVTMLQTNVAANVHATVPVFTCVQHAAVWFEDIDQRERHILDIEINK